MTQKIGVLLINLGTPDAATTKAVRIFLREFLLDPRVIDLPTMVRWVLVHLFILPFRPKQSAKAYASIWQKTGSPLLFHSQNLQQALQKKLGENFVVELAMRYGNPSMKEIVAKLMQQSLKRLIVIPLFPQYSSAATGSAIEYFLTTVKSYKNFPSIEICNDFFSDDHFIAAYANIIHQDTQDIAFEKIIFSYHGLPERQVVHEPEHFNYRTQCFKTSQLLANQLNLSPEKYLTTFQSRLGRTPWIKPYTDVVLAELAQQGIKHLAIACPSFVTDCLETLEEIGIRAQEQWHELGGKTLTLIPCLNSDPQWVDALDKIILN